jgi:hypothetical protein
MYQSVVSKKQQQAFRFLVLQSDVFETDIYSYHYDLCSIYINHVQNLILTFIVDIIESTKRPSQGITQRLA